MRREGFIDIVSPSPPPNIQPVPQCYHSIVYRFSDIPATTEDLLRECEITLYRASGPGGQHRNKVETAVRARHLPTGLVATAADSRSQARNRAVVLERLRAKLVARLRPRRKRVPTRIPASERSARLAQKRRRSSIKSVRGRTALEAE